MTNKGGHGCAWVVIGLVLLAVCGASLWYWRYNALPGEKQLARHVQELAYGAPRGDEDYCVPDLLMQACSGDFMDRFPPGTECYSIHCEWGHVTDLGAAGGSLQDLPPDVGRLRGLTDLNLSDNRLTAFTLQPGDLRHLQKLDLSDNLLTSLPPEIGQLTDLRELILTGNRLTSLPPELAQLRSLEVLDISGNPLRGPLPAWLTKLPLHYLIFAGTDLCVPADDAFQAWVQRMKAEQPASSTPYTIDQLCSLADPDAAVMSVLYEQVGSARGWDRSALPCTWDRVGCDFSGHVVMLDLARLDLTALPPQIGQLERLEYLGLGYNALTELPPEIGGLRGLGRLYVDNNRLTRLPAEIGQLTNLRELWLSSNQLAELPPELGSLTNLQFLELSDNPLRGPLPSFLFGMRSVQFIAEHTDFCLPDDPAARDWLRTQARGVYLSQGDEFAYVPPDPEGVVRYWEQNRACQ